jgi:glucose/arabinose dehydrogenase
MIGLAVMAGLSSCLAARSASAVSVPSGFLLENVAPAGFNQPTAMAFTPDGRIFVAEKRGVVRAVVNGTKLANPVWDGQTEVLNNGDRGLIGIAVDPQFGVNGFVYFLYIVDPDSNGVDTNDDSFGRLTRYRVSSADPNVVDPATRKVLIGRTWSEGFPSGGPSHSVGALRWGEDGSLLVSAGDGGQFSGVDPGGRDPGLFEAGRFDPHQDIGAFRAQCLQSLDGKILRVNPQTGAGYRSNPFFDGKLQSNTSRVWEFGLRNPFRFAVWPGTGVTDTSLADPGSLAIGDVGWMTWEETNIAASGGMNFGWPCFEGPELQPTYSVAMPSSHACGMTIETSGAPVYSYAAMAWNQTDPDRSSPKGLSGTCVIGGVFYTGHRYPMSYDRRLFFADFTMDWIRAAQLDDNGNLVDILDFVNGAEGAVDFATDPITGDVHYIAMYSGRIYRIRASAPLAVDSNAPDFAVGNPSPNPMIRSMSLSIDLPRAGTVRFQVLDLAGRTVWRDRDRVASPGSTTLRWDGALDRGGRAEPGVYWAHISVDGRSITRRFVRVH